MKPYHLILLMFLPACSTAPKLTLQPQPQAAAIDESAIRYPEIVRAYHLGRYVDPDDDLVMHEQHVVYRVEENSRWNFHSGPAEGVVPAPVPAHDAAFSPVPVNDDILAQFNAQRLATTEIILQARVLAAALAQFQTALQQTKTNWQETARLRVKVDDLQKRLDAIAAAPEPSPAQFSSPANEPADALAP